MDKYISANLKIIKNMEREYYFMKKIKLNMKVIFLKMNLMEMEHFMIMTEIIIQGSSKKEINLAKEKNMIKMEN